MNKCEHPCINKIRDSSTHTFDGRFLIVGVCSFLRDEQVDQERSQVSDQHTSRRMKSIIQTEAIHGKAQGECGDHQPCASHTEWQPKNKKEINIRSHHLVQ